MKDCLPMKLIQMAFLSAALIFAPVAASADELASLANGTLVLQVVDALQTRQIMQLQNPLPNGCTPHGFERNPLAIGIVRSDIGAIGSAVALNLLARVIFKHSPKSFYFIGAAEGVMIGINARALGVLNGSCR